MKVSLIKTLLATFACLTFGHAIAHASVENFENGNADATLAFQAIVDRNPGFDDMEILKIAFDESAGRLPQIVTDSNFNNNFLEFKSESNGFNGVFLFRNLSGEIRIRKLTRKTQLTDVTQDKGPLLKPAIKEYLFDFDDTHVTLSYAFQFKTGLVVLNEKIAKGQKLIEVRQFSPDILIYAVFATSSDYEAVKCDYKLSNDYNYWDKPISTKNLVPGQICAIGYSWKSK